MNHKNRKILKNNIQWILKNNNNNDINKIIVFKKIN